MAGNGTLQTVRQILGFMTKAKGFDRVYDKVSVVSAEKGRVVCEMTVEEDHQNKGGTLHGGLTATLVDAISTCALMTEGSGAPGVSVDLSVSYMKAAKLGEQILIDAKSIKTGRTLAFLTVDVTSKASGALLAQGKHTKYVGG